MDIRVLEASDAATYQEVRLRGLRTDPEAFGSTYGREAPFPLDFVAERLRPAEGKFVLGAFDEAGALVGVVAFVRETGLKVAHKGNVYGMYVVPEAQGRGAGKALMRALIERARACEGLERINLAVVTGNEPAIRLYRSLGFETYGTERQALKYEGRYADEHFMSLTL